MKTAGQIAGEHRRTSAPLDAYQSDLADMLAAQEVVGL